VLADQYTYITWLSHLFELVAEFYKGCEERIEGCGFATGLDTKFVPH
jgi:hypothetical protein